MAKKRKLESKSVQQQQIPQYQQHKAQQQQYEEYEDHEAMEDEEEYEQVDEEEQEEEDDDGEEEEDEGGDSNRTVKTLLPSVGASSDDEPVQNLLEPFSKEQLIDLLRYAADNHADVADRIRKVAEKDPAHRKIFVHGLGWDTNFETLTDAFKQYGEIDDCKAVTDKVTGKSKGYGFVLFKTRSGARNALKEPQKKIGNRMTSCQLASTGPVPSPAAVAAAAVMPSQPASEYTQRKIYVSNVGTELDPQKLLLFFSKYGEIEEGPLGLDKQTGKPRGFCLFVYKTIESAKRALVEPHKNFEGQILHCQKAIDGPKQNKPAKKQHHHHNPPQQNAQVQRNETPNYGHLMAPSAAAPMPYNQGAAALGQALTALLATQGAGLGGLTNLLGSLGTAGAVNPAVPGAAGQGGYGNQGGYGSQGGYSNQQMTQGGSSSWSQHGVGHTGAPYMGQ